MVLVFPSLVSPMWIYPVWDVVPARNRPVDLFLNLPKLEASYLGNSGTVRHSSVVMIEDCPLNSHSSCINQVIELASLDRAEPSRWQSQISSRTRAEVFSSSQDATVPALVFESGVPKCRTTSPLNASDHPNHSFASRGRT